MNNVVILSLMVAEIKLYKNFVNFSGSIFNSRFKFFILMDNYIFGPLKRKAQKSNTFRFIRAFRYKSFFDFHLPQTFAKLYFS